MDVLKPVVWLGDSLQRIRRLSPNAKQRIGFELERVQRGKMPRDCRPMPSVGSGVMEIRVHAEIEYRVFYVAKSSDAIFVLHAFVKKTGKTSKTDIALGKVRYGQISEMGEKA